MIGTWKDPLIHFENVRKILRCLWSTVADPDLELRGGPGLDFLALLAFFPSVISSFFLPKISPPPPPPGPSPRSATGQSSSVVKSSCDISLDILGELFEGNFKYFTMLFCRIRCTPHQLRKLSLKIIVNTGLRS